MAFSEENTVIKKAKRAEDISSCNENCCTSNYSYSKDNNDHRNCGMCLRNLSRGYSEGDASLVVDATLLLHSFQHDNSLKKIAAHGVASPDASSGETQELEQEQCFQCNNR